MKKKIFGKLQLILIMILFAILSIMTTACSLSGGSDDSCNHNLTHVDAKDSSCIENGNSEYWYCNDCGMYFKDAQMTTTTDAESVIIYASHNTFIVDAEKEDCTHSGHQAYYECKTCGKTFWDVSAKEPMKPEDALIPQTENHLFDDNKCRVCETDFGGSKKLSWEYKVGSYVLKGIGNCSDENIVIPATFNGNPVIEIAEDAFKDNTNIKSVTILSKVMKIGDNTFSGCTNLTSVILPENIKEIGNFAFYQSGLTSIVLPDSLETIGNYAFSGCDSLKEITLGKGLTSEEFRAFESCFSLEKVHVESLEAWFKISSYTNPMINGDSALYIDGEPLSGDIVIPEGTTEIPEYTFKNSSITSIVLPSSIKKVGADAFKNCTKLAKMELPFVYYEINFYTKYEIKLTGKNNIFGDVPTQLKEVIIYGGTTIPDEAFKNFTGLEKITLPSDLESIGDNAFYGCTNLANLNLTDVNITSIGESAFAGSNLNSIILPNTLKTLKANAFENCTRLTDVTIPAGVTGIASGVFMGCSNLKTVYFNATNCQTAGGPLHSIFEGCENLTDVVLGKNLLYLPDYLFSGCSFFTNIDLSETKITAIGVSAFENCTELSEIKLPESLKAINSRAFYGCEKLTEFILPSALENIGTYAFSYCSFKQFIIPDRVTRIPDYMLYNCYELENIIIPSNIVSIGEWAFGSCNSLTSITIPETVSMVGSSIFAYCDNLRIVYWNAINCLREKEEQKGLFHSSPQFRSVLFGEDVENVPYYAFAECSNLTDVNIVSEKLNTIDVGAFNNCTSIKYMTFFGKNSIVGELAFGGCSNLRSVSFNGSVSKIDKQAFKNCSSLTSVFFPENTDIIGELAFENCINLTQIILPNNLETIMKEAFKNCSKLDSINLPQNLVTVGEKAFTGCAELESVTLFSTRILKIGASAFAGCEKLKTVTGDGALFEIGNNAFSGCIGLTEIKLNDTHVIGETAFANCISLKKITIPKGWTTGGVTSIGNKAFANCIALEKVIWEARKCETAGSKDNYIFAGCTNITTIEIGENVNSIPSYAFSGCSGVKNIDISINVTTIHPYAFFESGIVSATFFISSGWYATKESYETGGTSINMSDKAKAAQYLKATYCEYLLYRK